MKNFSIATGLMLATSAPAFAQNADMDTMAYNISYLMQIGKHCEVGFTYKFMANYPVATVGISTEVWAKQQPIAQADFETEFAQWQEQDGFLTPAKFCELEVINREAQFDAIDIFQGDGLGGN